MLATEIESKLTLAGDLVKLLRSLAEFAGDLKQDDYDEIHIHTVGSSPFVLISKWNTGTGHKRLVTYAIAQRLKAVLTSAIAEEINRVEYELSNIRLTEQAAEVSANVGR